MREEEENLIDKNCQSDEVSKTDSCRERFELTTCCASPCVTLIKNYTNNEIDIPGKRYAQKWLKKALHNQKGTLEISRFGESLPST